jgi:dihydroorotase
MSAPSAQLSLRRPDDWHVHLRDGALLQAVAPLTAAQFARAIVMPNLSPPITTVAAARAYRQRILAAIPDGTRFTPLLTAYLTDTIDSEELERGFAEGVFAACKLYPANATTNSAAGVSDLAQLTAVFETLERLGLPLLIHGEVTDAEIDIVARDLKVKRGDKIARGQTVATSGQTGNVSSPQLHFELRKGSTPVDPMPHLSGQ